MGIKSLTLVTIASLLLAVSAWAADPSPSEQLLKDKGLTKLGAFYLLETDLKLNDGLRTIRAGESLLQTYTKKRRAIEADIAGAERKMDQWSREIQDLHDRMKKTADPRQYNNLVEENNNRVKMIAEGRKYIAQRKQDLTKLTAPTDHLTATIALADKMDEAASQYEALAKDEQVKGALATINEKSPTKMRLGPSAMFKDQLLKMRRARDAVGASAVRFEIMGGVPHVPTIINGSVVVPMVVDSGASLVTITSDIADKLKLAPRPDDKQVTLVVADGKKVDARVTTLQSIRVGQFSVKNVQCAILPANANGAGCLLGGTFLQSFIYQMDLAGGVLHLSPISAQAGVVSDGPTIEPPVAPTTAPQLTSTKPTSQPLAGGERRTLEIEATVDGSDQIKVTSAGLAWSHKSDGWPSDVRVNGAAWNPKGSPNLSSEGDLAFLHEADFATARVAEREGRNTVLMEPADDAATIYFSDPGPRRSHYRIKVSFLMK